MRKNLFIYLLVAIMLAFPVSGLCGLEDEEELDITEVVDEPEEENNTGVFESDGSTVLTATLPSAAIIIIIKKKIFTAN